MLTFEQPTGEANEVNRSNSEQQQQRGKGEEGENIIILPFPWPSAPSRRASSSGRSATHLAKSPACTH